jgi:uncharacterized protein
VLYVDSAVLVSLHCTEATTPAIRRWIKSRRGPWAASEWVMTECVSAFGLKVRRRELTATEAHLAIASIETLIAESFEVLAIGAPHYRQARQWLGRFDLGLRAADALHLAVAHAAGCQLATYDAAFIDAANALKIKVAKISV